MTQLPAVVQASSYIGSFVGARERTTVILIPPPNFDYGAASIQWPLILFLPGDVEKQNPPGTKYKITVERVEE